ncbi:MAG: HEAT repeat domain-containing protein [Mariniblastus sp.]
MSKDHNLTYIGSIRSLIADGKQIAFVTEHTEGKFTPLYLIDGETNKLSSVELPSGGVAVCKLGEQFFVSGKDGSLYSATGQVKTATALKTKIPSIATLIVKVDEDLIACVCDNYLVLIDAKGKPLQSIAVGESSEKKITAVSASSDGTWLAVGDSDGVVSVYEREEKTEFVLSESAQLHKGAVHSILFEPDELRFFSAGADQKSLLTHARGSLEPEDRGRANTHKERVTGMVLAGQDRFITGSLDKTCKTWARSNATKPATLSDGIVAVIQLATATVHKRTNLVVAQSDNSIRLFLLTEDGKFGQPTERYNDGFRRAKDLFDSNSPADRGDALHELATNDDRESVAMLAARVSEDKDNKLRLTAAKLICQSTHPSAVDHLEQLLGHPDSPIRTLAFDHLTSTSGSNQNKLELCRKAIDTRYADIGCNAIKAVEKLSADKSETDGFRNRAREVLVESFDSDTIEIRRASILALENAFEKNSARPSLIALQSSHADSRRIGLIRLMQRKLLADADGGIRQKIEDIDPDVRKTATLLLILSQPKLAQAVRLRAQDIDRQLIDLENFSITETTKKTPKTGSKSKKTKSKKTGSLPQPNLKDEDYQPLLIAVSSRAMDTCLVGAKCLALLEDPRAFGILMQLSREENTAARVEVCKSLAALNDARANERLSSMLADPDIEVRDAAYTAIETIRSDDPLAAATDGLSAMAEDVRKRGLDTLVKQLKKSDVKDARSPSALLLQQALNDSNQSVRNEAFKIVLNANVGGGNDKTLRFALSSIHPDVRREVLTETMAQQKEKWAAGLLLELLNDPNSEIRSDTLDHLKKEQKETEIAWLEPVCKTKYSDIRLKACQRLASNKTVAARKILAGCIDDKDKDVREVVLKSLVDSNAIEKLQSALESENEDVRLGAAFALASRGDISSRDVLLSAVNEKRPIDEAFEKRWEATVVQGFQGLARLGDPSTLDIHLEKLDSENVNIRKSAAQSLHWVTTPETAERIKPFMQHDDEGVKSRAAFTVAMAGDPVALPAIFSSQSQTIKDDHRLMVGVAQGDETEGRLFSFIDQAVPKLRNVALLVLLCRDWLQHDGSPRRTIACLAANDPRTRLFAAQAVESFCDREKFSNIINFIFNDRGDDKPWTISAETIEKVASTICFADTLVAARLVLHLRFLGSEKQKDWNNAWVTFSARYEREIEAALLSAKNHPLPNLDADQSSLNQLAFGTYVGLAREQGSYHQIRQRPGFGATVISVRCAAIRRLIKLTETEQSFSDSSVSVLTQTVGDPNQQVRQLAFEQLAVLNVDDSRRAAIAMESGHQDLAVAGLLLLTKSGKKSDQVKLLTNVVLSRNDRIAIEAATLLKDQIGLVELADVCFDSPNTKLVFTATTWLASSYDESESIKKRLREIAEDCEDAMARYWALGNLIKNQDKQAFELVRNIIENGDEADRKTFIPELHKLTDNGVSSFIIERLKSNPLDGEKLFFHQLKLMRDPTVVGDLVEIFESQPKWQSDIFNTLKSISGYDQRIVDPDDQLVDRSFLKSERPRNDEVLARTLDLVGRTGNANFVKSLIPGARWAADAVIDPPLNRLATISEDAVRWSVIEAIGFRAEKRNGSLDSLKEAIEHRDPITKFMAAEGLARASDNSGIHVLLAAVDLMEDLRLRRRAVLALGQLGDERAFDRLITLASETGHALQDSAAEALGRIQSSANRDKILQTLLRLVKGGGSAAQRSLVGLRWLDAPEGWGKIREVASSPNDQQLIAIEQLGYDSAPASRDLLGNIISTQPSVAVYALESAKRSYGIESIEPELVWLKSKTSTISDVLTSRAIDRICDNASDQQVFDLLAVCEDRIRQPLIEHLLQTDPLPVDVASESLDHTNATVVEAAAWIIGRSGQTKLSKSLAQPLDVWLSRTADLDAELTFKNEYADEKFDDFESCVKRLVWAAGVLGGSESTLAKIPLTYSSESFATIRRSAITALVQSAPIPAAAIKTISSLAQDKDAEIRSGIAEIMSKSPKAKLDNLAKQLLPDRVAFSRLANRQATEIDSTLKEAVADSHYQPRTLSYLIKSQDVKTLASVAENSKLGLVARLGAVEGLAVIANAESEKILASVGNEEKNEEELRKAAWKGLRRSRRRSERRSATLSK